MLTTDMWLEWGGSNRGTELPPSHIALGKEGLKAAGLKAQWYRWAARTPDGTIRGDWIKVKK